MEQIAGTTFDEAVKRHNKKASIKDALIEEAKNHTTTPRAYTYDSVRSLWTAEENMRMAMECVCEFIFEYYGIQPREYRNEKRMEQVGFIDEHKAIINQWYNVDQKITEFMDTKYGDEYKEKHWVPHETDNSVNVVQVANVLVENEMQRWDIKTGLENELEKI